VKGGRWIMEITDRASKRHWPVGLEGHFKPRARVLIWKAIQRMKVRVRVQDDGDLQTKTDVSSGYWMWEWTYKEGFSVMSEDSQTADT
jgi:hypothetical protein